MQFVNIITNKEKEIFFDYCRSNKIKFCSGKLVIPRIKLFEGFKKGFAIFFDGEVDDISYAAIGYAEKFPARYIERDFKDVFKISKFIIRYRIEIKNEMLRKCKNKKRI